MGIYVFGPEVREFIPPDQRFDFPELVQVMLANRRNVLSYETDAYWMDIGRPDDYKQANEDFPAMQGEFLRAYVESATV
jgi:NDP-sugar pyrophosphorylase family protein